MNSNLTLLRNAQQTKAVMLAGATQNVVGGETKVGVGGVDYRDTSQHYMSFDYSGASNDPHAKKKLALAINFDDQ